jgi:hypothetical protein
MTWPPMTIILVAMMVEAATIAHTFRTGRDALLRVRVARLKGVTAPSS